MARKGSYIIGTDKVNGIYFRDSGFFENIGNNVVTLTAYGSPIATGTFSYALNTVPSCSFQAAAENESLLVIASQPEAPAASCSGVGTISLSVSVSGITGITYAWRRNGLVLSDDAVISGSQTAILQLANPRSSDSGIYDAVISGDGTSPISSAAVEVAVNPSPRVVAADQTICLPGTANLTLPGDTLGSTAGLAYSYFTDALATVPYGSASAAGVGTYYIKGTSTLGCFDIKPVTVSSSNPEVAAIEGGAYTVSVGSETPAFTNAASGGLWSVENGTGVASIDSSGIVRAVSAGDAAVVYTVTNSGCSGRSVRPLTIVLGGFIDQNALCTGRMISKTACSEVLGAAVNDDAATALGVEYDWGPAADGALGVGFGASSASRSLVEIGGQCWARYNSDVANSNDSPAVNDGIDKGSSDYYGSAANEPAPNEGLLYQWSAAMDGSSSERAQGVCPDGWHIPSDCEWMFLENSLGMAVSDQVSTGSRSSGGVGTKLKAAGSAGFAGLLSGFGNYAPSFIYRGNFGYYWSSSDSSSGAFHRDVALSSGAFYRNAGSRAYSFSVRCLKD